VLRTRIRGSQPLRKRGVMTEKLIHAAIKGLKLTWPENLTILG